MNIYYSILRNSMYATLIGSFGACCFVYSAELQQKKGIICDAQNKKECAKEAARKNRLRERECQELDLRQEKDNIERDARKKNAQYYLCMQQPTDSNVSEDDWNTDEIEAIKMSPELVRSCRNDQQSVKHLIEQVESIRKIMCNGFVMVQQPSENFKLDQMKFFLNFIDEISQNNEQYRKIIHKINNDYESNRVKWEHKHKFIHKAINVITLIVITAI